jgi:ArsR family transcriptional regulator
MNASDQGQHMTGWRDFTELRAELRALSSVASLNIVHQLGMRPETNVTDLALSLALSQPLVSWHLRNLRLVGLVSTRRQGREVFCSLDRARFEVCMQALRAVVSGEDLPREIDPHDVDDAEIEREHSPPRLRAGPPSG